MSKVEALKEFLEYMTNTADEMLEELEDRDYDGKYDIIIVCNSNMVRVELHADSHSRLMHFIEEEIKEAQQ